MSSKPLYFCSLLYKLHSVSNEDAFVYTDVSEVMEFFFKTVEIMDNERIRGVTWELEFMCRAWQNTIAHRAAIRLSFECYIDRLLNGHCSRDCNR